MEEATARWRNPAAFYVEAQATADYARGPSSQDDFPGRARDCWLALASSVIWDEAVAAESMAAVQNENGAVLATGLREQQILNGRDERI